MPSASCWCCSSSWSSISTARGASGSAGMRRAGPWQRALVSLVVWSIVLVVDLPADLDGADLGQAADRALPHPADLLAAEHHLRALPHALRGDALPALFPQLGHPLRLDDDPRHRRRGRRRLQPDALLLSRPREARGPRALHLSAALGRAGAAALSRDGEGRHRQLALQPGDRLYDLRAALCALAAALLHGEHAARISNGRR